MAWLKSNDIEFTPTGKFYKAKIGTMKDKTGELVKVLSWGGIILKFEYEKNIIHVTYDISDLEEVEVKE